MVKWLMHKFQYVALLLGLSFLLVNSAETSQSTCYIDEVDTGSTIEHRFFCADHHFMTLVDEDGTINLRPHPGCDVNGWGTSWYFQPFFPGATFAGSTIDQLTASGNTIHLETSGTVSGDTTPPFSTWQATLDLQFDIDQKEITGVGTYDITLDAPLDNTTSDLNLYRIASNYLDDVPLLSGGIGDTGDMSQANVSGDNVAFTWIPPDQPAHFPTDPYDVMQIEVVGAYNEVDTVAQGYEPIEDAYKPTVTVELDSTDSNTGMTFGGIYSTTQSQDFWADNVGITPLIPKSSTQTVFDFDVTFNSTAIEPDGWCEFVPTAMQFSDSGANYGGDDSLPLILIGLALVMVILVRKLLLFTRKAQS